MRKALLTGIFLLGLSLPVSAGEIDPAQVVIKTRTPVYYVRLTKNARVHNRPSLLRKTTVAVLKKGEILPVWNLVSSPYGIFFRVGKNLFVHYSVAEVVPWL